VKYVVNGTVSLFVTVTWDGDGTESEPWDVAPEYLLDAFRQWVKDGGPTANGMFGCVTTEGTPWDVQLAEITAETVSELPNGRQP
jgi:hypothetical protein